MPDPTTSERAKALWAAGNYEKVAAHFGSAAETAVAAAGIGSGDRALDVACGTGNATIPAARTGATVTGLDITPELLAKARAGAEEAGVEIDFVEGDAGAMPFEDGSFDRVISVFGCMFVPDHRTGASELARVLGDRGRLAVLAWTPGGINGSMFTVIGEHMPPPPEGFQPPIQWGDEDHVRDIFDGTGLEIEFDRGIVPQRFDSLDQAMEWLENDVPPMVMAKAALQPEGKWDALLADLREMEEEAAETADDGSITLNAEYLVTKGAKG